MTIDKNTWSKLSKKYPTKASWVRALNDLVWGDHEELYSALIELDISDLAPESRPVSGSIFVADGSDFKISPLDSDSNVAKTDKVQVALGRANEALRQSNDALARADALLEELEEEEDDPEVNLYFHGSGFDTSGIISEINRELGRDRGLFGESEDAPRD